MVLRLINRTVFSLAYKPTIVPLNARCFIRCSMRSILYVPGMPGGPCGPLGPCIPSLPATHTNHSLICNEIIQKLYERTGIL